MYFVHRIFVLAPLGALVFAMTASLALATGVDHESLPGTRIDGGVECPQFRLTDGEVISLMGTPPDALGAYTLVGRWARVSKCMQGRSFQVQSWTINLDLGGLNDDAN